MPALGQKRKCPGSRGTSVLPSGADIVSLPRHVRLVPTRDSCAAAKNISNRSPSTIENTPAGMAKPSAFRSFEVDDLFELCFLLDWQIRGLLNLEDSTNMVAQRLRGPQLIAPRSQSPSRNLAMSGPNRLEKSSLQGYSPGSGVCKSQSFNRPKSSSFLAKIMTVENLIIGSPPETSSSS